MKFVFALADKGWQRDGNTVALMEAHTKLKRKTVKSLVSYYFTRRGTEKSLRPEWKA